MSEKEKRGRAYAMSWRTDHRRFTVMPVLDGYILREFAIVFSICLLAFATLFLIGDLINDLQDFLTSKEKLSTLEIAYYFLLRLVENVRMILPLSLLLAAVYVMATMGKNNEITAMRASGVSLLRCGGSLYAMAAVVMIVNFWINERLAPYCVTESAIMIKCAQNPNYREEFFSMKPYRSPDGLRSWLLGNFSEDGVQRNVKIKKYGTRGNLEWDMLAEKASYAPAEGWTFHNVTLTYFDQVSRLPKTPEKFATLRKTTEEFPESPTTIAIALKPASEISSADIVRVLGAAGDISDVCARVYKSTLFYNMSLPWVCLLSVFLSIPLAGRNERRGIMISVVSAVLIIVAYICVAQIALVMGKRGLLPPFIAGAGPTLALAGYVWAAIIRDK